MGHERGSGLADDPSAGTLRNLNWGLSGIFQNDFKTVEQTLYPIYGSVGVFWRIEN